MIFRVVVCDRKERLSNYEIKQELGRGRVAITYLATNRDGKNVVIKTLNPDLLNQLSLEECNYLKSGFADEAPKVARCEVHRKDFFAFPNCSERR